MDTVHVHRLRARYRLPAGDGGARERLDRVLREVLDSALEAALARAGIRADEEVCLRRVSAPARLSLLQADSAMADAWGGALAEAIRSTLAAGGPGVVRYSSRAHALVDLLASVAAGDLRRAWAWRQMGLWSAGEDASPDRAAEEAARVLAAHPEHAVAALAEAARAGALPALAARVRPSAWTALARAALDAAAVPAAALLAPAASAGGPAVSSRDDVEPSTSPDAASPGPTREPASAAPATGRAVERIVRASAIARFVTTLSINDEAARRALAVLAVLEADPAALRRRSAEARAVLDGVEREIAAAAEVAALSRPSQAERREDRGPSREANPPRRIAAGEDAHREEAAEAADVDLSASSDRHPATTSDAASEEEERPLPPVRRAGETRWGGLLFLIHVVTELRIADEVMDDAVLGVRPLRWTLHRLGRELLALDERDPAALAFAGLGPDRDPPSRGEPAATEEEERKIAELARRIAAALHLRLRGEEARDARAAAALLREVCLRRAAVEADPGWLDVRLALDEVRTDVRRAGLDLDPGWVPWLGAVVRFVYA